MLPTLQWGNSVSDLLANRAIALQGGDGPAKMAISGCYGEPIFNRFFGVGISYIAICLAAGRGNGFVARDSNIFIDASLVVCFSFQWLALVVAVVLPPCDRGRDDGRAYF